MDSKKVEIPTPKVDEKVFRILGLSPLVVRRRRHEPKSMMRRKPEPLNRVRFISSRGWDGYPTSAIRASMVDVCRLSGFCMIRAKLGIFPVHDGVTRESNPIPLARIYGKAEPYETAKWGDDGKCHPETHAFYDMWNMHLRIRWDSEQFSVKDIRTLLDRVGTQLGFSWVRVLSRFAKTNPCGLFTVSEDLKEYGLPDHYKQRIVS